MVVVGNYDICLVTGSKGKCVFVGKMFLLNGIIRIQKDEFFVHLEIFIKFAFGLDHAFQASKPFQMCFSEICDVSVVWLCDLTEPRDLIGVICAHFYDSDFRGAVHRQQAKGNPYVVV